MDADPVTTSSSGSSVGRRKERGVIAVQACSTCRLRKQKCNESRPKCSLCQRLNLECIYQESLPTKKDKTLVEILDQLKRLETKVDRLPNSFCFVGTAPGPAQSIPASQSSTNIDIDDPTTVSITPSTSQNQPSQHVGPVGVSSNRSYRNKAAAHEVLVWPETQQIIQQAMPSTMRELKILENNGLAFLLQVQQGAYSLSLDDVLEAQPFDNAGGTRVRFPELTWEVMHRLATSYFDSFNLLYPFLNRRDFMSDTLRRVHIEGFDNETISVVALLVLGLGELAIEGSRGPPIENFDGRQSGVRGGTKEKPPGIGLFNEGRKRLGFVMARCDLESVQALSLTALYYGSSFQHLEFWKLSASASLACQVLITNSLIVSDAPNSDLIKRIFWHCATIDTALYLDMNIAPTAILNLVEEVGMPSFDVDRFCEDDERANQASHFYYHHASQVALGRLCANIYQTIGDPSSDRDNGTTNDGYSWPSTTSLMDLSKSLDRWRSMLPQELQWTEDDPTSFPSWMSMRGFNRNVDPSLSTSSRSALFTENLNDTHMEYPYVYDIHVALLRTRYYYAKYMVYRPFVYKALHLQGNEPFTDEDASGAAECLKACLKWPLALSPTSRHKRLIPYLFCWSQNFLGILIIFLMTERNLLLAKVRRELCGAFFEKEINATTATMIDWIRDTKSVDPTTKWCWDILKSIYEVHGKQVVG